MSHMVEGSAAATATAADSRVSKSTIESAVNALLKHKAAQSSTQKLQLLPGDDYIYLNLTLKKIPSNPRTNPYRISLPHPILDASSQLCLIIDDRPKSTTPPSDQIKKLIKAQNIPISKVIKVSKLKTNYKPFEAKRKLCDSYDLFFVDKRVVHLLPKLLGKQFFKKKKLPLGVDLGKKNLKLKVEMALGSALMYVRSGTCCVMKVGKVEMEKTEVVENVFDAIKGAVERVPKKWGGVRSLHLKFSDSVALPIYQAMPDVKLKIEGLKDIEEGAEIMKISDNVKETSGKKDNKTGKKKKGRIHEVNYMDIGEDVASDDEMEENVSDDDEVNADEIKKTEKEELDIDQTVGKKRSKDKASKAKAKRNGSEEVADMQGTEKEELDIDQTVGKKRSKDKASKAKAKKNEVADMQGTEEDLDIDQTVGKKRSTDKASKTKAKAEKNVGKKPKKNGSEEVADMQGKKESELGRKPSERIAKKRVASK